MKRILGAVLLGIVLTTGCGDIGEQNDSSGRLPGSDVNPVTKGAVDHVIQGVLPYLMRADEKSVPHPVPEYLESATLKRTKRGQTVTYRLNPRARWSDGRPIGYADFVAQARALSGRERRYEVSTDSGYRLIKHIPFKVQRIDRTDKTVTLARDPSWWGPPAKLDRIVYRAMDTSAMPGAFANHEIDLMDIGLDASAMRRVQGVPGTDIRRAGGPDWRHFTFNAASPVLSDVRVRRAVMLGIDREVIARSDLSGLGVPVQTLGNHFYVNTQNGYQDNSAVLGGYDPAQAGRLLDEAGWRQHGKYRAKAGRTLALRFVVPSGVPISAREAELARALLERIGVRVDIQPVPADDALDAHVTKGDFDIVPFSWLGTSFPVSPMRAVFARPHAGRVQQNYSRTGTAAIDAAMDRTIAETDPAKVHDLVNGTDRLIWRQASVLPLYQRPQLVAARADLANMGACGFLEPDYQDIGFTSR